MPDFDDSKTRQRFIERAYQAFGATYRNDLLQFSKFVEDSLSDSRRERFLNLAALYYYFVKEGHYYTTNDEGGIEEYAEMGETLKYVTIVSVIETAMTDEPFVDFFSWLNSRKQRNRFPIKDKSQLEDAYEQYSQDFGATKKLLKFLQLLTSNEKAEFLDSIQFENQMHKSLDRVAKELYRLRSEFVHNAQTVWVLGERVALSNRRSNSIVYRLSIAEFCEYFERCFLRQFGLLEVSNPM